MVVDVRTLFLLTIDVEAILGLLLLFAYVQNTSIPAVAWWGWAHLLRAVSLALYGMYGQIPDLLAIDLADAVLFASFAVTWNGARVFDGRRPRPGSLLIGAMVWIVVCQAAGLTAASPLRGVISGVIIASYIWLTACEFWRGRDEGLVSRWPAIVVLFAHGSVFLLRTPLTAVLPWSTASEPALASAWMTVMSTEALLATISVAFILLAMAKERTELRHKTAAMTDPLTGLFNRRAFLEAAVRLIDRQIARERPVAVFMIDLDRFKSINDRFGHSMGDAVLQIFAQTVRARLRVTDLVGRLGGEEFALVLADACRDNAFAVADRIRQAFAAAAAVVDGHEVMATASIGVAIIQDPEQDLATLLTQADQALYLAKADGRNRVVVVGLDLLVESSADGPHPLAPDALTADAAAAGKAAA
jgi:diguanylate cyclase (GGDEF)-like protein